MDVLSTWFCCPRLVLLFISLASASAVPARQPMRDAVTRLEEIAGHAVLGRPDQQSPEPGTAMVNSLSIAEKDAVADRAPVERGSRDRRRRRRASELGRRLIASGRTRDHAAAADRQAACPGGSAAPQRRCRGAVRDRRRPRRQRPRPRPAKKLDLADEIGDEAVGRRVIDLAGAADLHDAAAAHDADGVAHRQRLFLVVGDQDEGDADLALQVLQLDLHVAAQLAVERGQRLVEQQHGRPVDQRARQRHALLLAAGQFLDPPPAIAGSRTISSASSTRRSISRERAAAGAGAGRRPTLLGDIEMRKQRVVLEHHVDRPAIGRHADHVLAGDQHLAFVGCSKPPIMRRHVVLPQPDGPRKEWNEPRGIAKDTPSTARPRQIASTHGESARRRCRRLLAVLPLGFVKPSPPRLRSDSIGIGNRASAPASRLASAPAPAY